ncbi:4'-phosphopantetheinyl transferase family protein [Enterobacter cloacae]|nr:4'-phosphopantetheinyl transferase superfamily protein [Enterobacter cloacae]
MEKFNPKVIKNTADIFLTSTEKKNLESTGIESHIALLIAFSAKESLFKAIYPLTRSYFSFDAARILEIEGKSQTFTMELLLSLSNNFPVGSQYRGFYKIYNDCVITLIYGSEI